MCLKVLYFKLFYHVTHYKYIKIIHIIYSKKLNYQKFQEIQR